MNKKCLQHEINGLNNITTLQGNTTGWPGVSVMSQGRVSCLVSPATIDVERPFTNYAWHTDVRHEHRSTRPGGQGDTLYTPPRGLLLIM